MTTLQTFLPWTWRIFSILKKEACMSSKHKKNDKGDALHTALLKLAQTFRHTKKIPIAKP